MSFLQAKQENKCNRLQALVNTVFSQIARNQIKWAIYL